MPVHFESILHFSLLLLLVALQVAFGPDGVLNSIKEGKAYVDASTVGPGTSKKISDVRSLEPTYGSIFIRGRN